jgi:DNA-binding transcriptional MerR regulator
MLNRKYSITELAQLMDVTTRTIRYYEEFGLISPDRQGKTRWYKESDRVRLKLILRGRRLGFSLQEIEEMVSLYDSDPTEVTQLQEVIRRGDQRIRAIEEQIHDLQAVHAELQDFRTKMMTVLLDKLKEEKVQ